MYGPDGPVSGVGINVDKENGRPRMLLYTAGGGSILLTFMDDGTAVVHVKHEDGTDQRLVP